MVQYARPRHTKKKRNHHIIPHEKALKIKLVLDKIISNRQKAFSESSADKKRHDFLLLYYRECLRFALYRLMEFCSQNQAHKIIKQHSFICNSFEISSTMFNEGASLGLPQETLQKIGVLATMKMKLHSNEAGLEANIKDFLQEISRVNCVLNNGAENLYQKYIHKAGVK